MLIYYFSTLFKFMNVWVECISCISVKGLTFASFSCGAIDNREHRDDLRVYVSRKEWNSPGSLAVEVGRPLAGGWGACAHLDPVLSHGASHFQVFCLGLLSHQTTVLNAAFSPILESWRTRAVKRFPPAGGKAHAHWASSQHEVLTCFARK